MSKKSIRRGCVFHKPETKAAAVLFQLDLFLCGTRRPGNLFMSTVNRYVCYESYCLSHEVLVDVGATSSVGCGIKEICDTH